MAYSSGDVPNIFDVWINDTGYMFAEDTDSSYFSRHTIYGQTPTFIERQNVGAAYGDDQQAFWMTASQNDWSGGEDQKFYRIADSSTHSKAWRLEQVRVEVQGEISLNYSIASSGPGSTVTNLGQWGNHGDHFAVDDTYFYTENSASTKVAHGAGTVTDVAGDSNFAYVAGTTRISKISSPATPGAASSFSASISNWICVHNNTLYGLDYGKLYSYATDGTQTTVFTWKDAEGSTASGLPGVPFGSTLPVSVQAALCSFGGTLLILRHGVYSPGAELWTYNGTATEIAVKFPSSFFGTGVCVVGGIAYIAGIHFTTYESRGAVYSWDGNTLQEIWAAPPGIMAASMTKIIDFGRWVVWVDGTYGTADSNAGRVMIYDPGTQSASCLFQLPGTFSQTNAVYLSTSGLLLFAASGHSGDVPYQYQGTSASQSSGYVETSQFDFDSSLKKLFRGIKVDWVAASDGDGGSVDIAYQVDGAGGTYTNLQTGATSGTEYTLTNISGHSISIKVTLNKGTSTFGPKLKRIYARAAPILNTYRRVTYVLDLSGNKLAEPPNYQTLVNNATYDLDGTELRDKLITAMQSTSPITIVDRVGSYTGIIEPDSVQIEEIRSDYGRAEYKAWITCREV